MVYRIDNATAVTTLPPPAAIGPNPQGYFTDGDPASQIPATVVDDDWLNMVQEELANAVTGDGTALSKTDNTQLRAKLTGRYLGTQRFVSSGTYQRSAGARTICIRYAVSGGGSGAGSLATTSGECSTCSGGATGSWIASYWFDVTDTPTAPVSIGTGGTASSGTGNTGGATTVTGTGWSISLPGGNGGSVKQDPTTTTFDMSAQANGGGAPTVTGALAAGFASNGVPGPCGLLYSGTVVSGQGASCPSGGGGPNTNNGNGGNASGYGAGGGGAAAPASSATVTGGLGAAGIVLIEEYS